MWPLAPGVNVLLGRNGVGKTNLVEALGYLATQSSHRVSSDQPLVRRGADPGGVRGAVVHDGRELLLELEINPGAGQPGAAEPGAGDPDPRSARHPADVLFAPEDLAIVRGDPSERRRFLDELLVMRTPRFAGRQGRLRPGAQAAQLAAQVGRRQPPVGWTRPVGAGGLGRATRRLRRQLLAGRLALVEALRPFMVAAYADVAPESEPAGLVVPHVAGELTGDTAVDELRQAYLDEIARRRGNELDRGVTLVGPHRDELELLLGPGPAKGYASHGESWSMALALRLGAIRSAARRRDRAGADPRRRLRRAGHVPAGQPGPLGGRRRAGRGDRGGRRGRARRAGPVGST